MRCNILHVPVTGSLKRQRFLVRHLSLGSFMDEVVDPFRELVFRTLAKVIAGNRLFCNITDTDKQ